MNWKKGCAIMATACCFPYIITLGWTGNVAGRDGYLMEEYGKSESGRRRVILDREQESAMDVEQYLAGVVARQMPASYELEALKAQAVIARTYIHGLMEGDTEIPESALNMDYFGQAQMEQLWGTKNFMKLYEKVEQAISETKGVVMKYEGTYIDPWFSQCSGGITRPGDESHPYLASVECPEDLEAENYLQIKEWTREEFAKRISSIPDKEPILADQIKGTIQIGERDEAGYVMLVQIGNQQYTGEEIQYALELNSSFYRLEDYEGNIRAVVKGIGHGYGLSQYEANEKALEGWGYEEILMHFYQNITLVSE